MSSREEIFKHCREFFAREHAPKPFIPGETYIPVTAKGLDAEDLLMLVDSSLDMWLTAGRFTREFEAILPKYFQRDVGSLFVNSGSSANLLAVSSLGAPMLKSMKLRPLEPGDEVITVAAGFPTTVNPILQNGWVPVFVDVDFSTLNATFDQIRSAKTPKTRAVVLAHTLGNPYRADLISDWCRKEGLYLVEDCCDAFGARIHADGEWRSVGSFGEFATLSFYPAHHITTGEGGAVLPTSGKWKRVAESLRDWGRDCWCETGRDNTCGKRFGYTFEGLPAGYDHKYTYTNIGYNLKSTDMQAAIGLSQLKKLECFVEKRRKNWSTLNAGIRSSPTLQKLLTPVQATESTEPSWFGFPMHCDPSIDREAMVRYLESHKVGTRLVFGGNLTRQPAYRGANYRVHGELQNTNRIMAQTFWIGVHPGLDEQKIAYMLEQLEAGLKASRR